MALSALSKHCIITGWLFTFLCLIYLVMHTLLIQNQKNKTIPNDGKLDENEMFMQQQNYAILNAKENPLEVYGIGALAVICNLLMIVGIHKRRIILMIPFYLFILATLAMASFAMYSVWSFFFGNSFFITGMTAVAIIALIFMIFNPFVAIIFEIRREHSAKQKQHVRHVRI